MRHEKQNQIAYGLGTLDKLYHQDLLDHARHPRGQEQIPNPDIYHLEENLFCGDEISVFVSVKQGKFARIAMEGRGCAVSIASGSIMVEFLKGKFIEQTFGYYQILNRYLTKKGISSEEAKKITSLEILSPVRDYPIRAKCALLCWVAMLQGIRKYESQDS